MRRLWHGGRRAYLPVLAGQALRFARYDSTVALENNRFGIAEPVIHRGQARPARFLDVVLMPLVAFDNAGNRLGMGGGFYDRTFAFLGQRQHGGKPLLVGIAYECQHCDSLPVESWDIPLRAIVTERRVVHCSRSAD